MLNIPYYNNPIPLELYNKLTLYGFSLQESCPTYKLVLDWLNTKQIYMTFFSWYVDEDYQWIYKIVYFVKNNPNLHVETGIGTTFANTFEQCIDYLINLNIITMLKEYLVNVTYITVIPVKVTASNDEDAEDMAVSKAENINSLENVSMYFDSTEIMKITPLDKIDFEGE